MTGISPVHSFLIADINTVGSNTKLLIQQSCYSTGKSFIFICGSTAVNTDVDKGTWGFLVFAEAKAASSVYTNQTS